MSLPIFQSADKNVGLLQTSWSSYLNPLIDNPANKGIILQKVALATGVNAINHLLGRKLQGWSIVRLRAASAIYDSQDTNIMPDKTLILNSSAPVVVDILVF